MANVVAPTKRLAQRVRISAFVRVTTRGDLKEFIFRTRDMSTSGLFLSTKVVRMYPFRVGTLLDVELYDNDKTVTCRAEVVRIVGEHAEEDLTGFGVKIVDCAPEHKMLLASWIERERTQLT